MELIAIAALWWMANTVKSIVSKSLMAEKADWYCSTVVGGQYCMHTGKRQL